MSTKKIQSIYDLLEQYNELIINQRDKGTSFEKLMKSFLETEPLYIDQYKKVYMWSEFPHKVNAQDHGIDLVAEGHDGEFTAIQCKFYAPTYLVQKGDIDSFFTESGKTFQVEGKRKSFVQRIIVSTSDRWSEPAEKALDSQTIPVIRFGVGQLEQSSIDWSKFSLNKPDQLIKKEKKKPRAHQVEAIDKVMNGFQKQNRGKLIMACGTGKTFTALKLAESVAKNNGLVLFLVPSISLLSQTLKEWTIESEESFHAFAVCSDSKVGKSKEDMSKHDLTIPASTDTTSLIKGLERVRKDKKMTVIFSTYQSIDVVSEAQKKGLSEFDIIICDEAHRTTGATVADQEDSHFVKVHDQKFISTKKRLYMTATPRIFSDAVQTKAKENSAILYSMDDETLYGPEFYHLGFGKAVNDGLLTDYKVLVLAIDEGIIDPKFQKSFANEDGEIPLEDIAKIIGCWNGLSKRLVGKEAVTEDEKPMRRAVAFARKIEDSKKIVDMFDNVIHQYTASHPDIKNILKCELAHVDGGFNVLDRESKLTWLKEETPEDTCRILSNARCLSEGVDVPALDAVLFLNARDSMVDVVQSVGRIMRKAEGKKYGYVILPIGIPAGVPAEEALKDNKKYKVVWQVLQALRAHDERLDAEINKLDLNKNKSGKINVSIIGQGGGSDDNETNGGEKATRIQVQLSLLQLEEYKDAIYAKIVAKCGTRPYWENWATEVAEIAKRHTAQVKDILAGKNPEPIKAFESFLNGIRKNLNPSISEADAIEMLSQQLITKPVFDALFSHYKFTELNPVSQSMQSVLSIFDSAIKKEDAEYLKTFYASVRMVVKDINNAEARQRIIKELYDRFFNVAFKKMSERLGIVYTPIEVVDFIINSVEDVMQEEFGKSLSDKGVNILDPFTGTGTFMVRLLQSGIIKKEDLKRKFQSELHANELVLLAYYIATINIEETYNELISGDYQPFAGAVLTDTFQLDENNAQTSFAVALPEIHKRVEKQKKENIHVIISNPPYSAGQGDANDNNQNLAYPALDNKIRKTYAALSEAINKNSLYDSYIRGIKWATDRIGDEGIIGFVTNGSFIDSNSADGLRKTLVSEFSKIYCFNLRGNARTSGEERRREKGNVFGEGTRTPVAITIFIKSKNHTGDAEIFYNDIGDYLNREEKLKIISNLKTVKNVPWIKVFPNKEGDWVKQRNPEFDAFLPIGDKKSQEDKPIFQTYSRGLSTSRDVWCYNFSKVLLDQNINRMINFYNLEVDRLEESRKKDLEIDLDKFVNNDSTRISWNRSLKSDLNKLRKINYKENSRFVGLYRPFCKQFLYFNKNLNDMIYQLPKIFPTIEHNNFVICTSGVGASRFSVFITNVIPDVNFFTPTQAFPLYQYEKPLSNELDVSGETNLDAYIRRDAITDMTLEKFRLSYEDNSITKEKIFYYIYGLLHSASYKDKYQNDFKKMLPRIPLLRDFWGFSNTGESLANLHINYESAKPYELSEEVNEKAIQRVDGFYKVNETGMKFFGTKKTEDKTRIIFNSYVTLSGIPESAYEYILNGKSAIEWVMEKYVISKDKDSGIVNDPNEWSDDPRYIIDLVKRVVTVSMETIRLVNALPPFELLEEDKN